MTPKQKQKQKKERPKGIRSFFLRGLVTVLPVVLTLIVFGLILQGVNEYVVSPINRVIYWSLEHNTLGWQALESLGIDPLEREYLDETRLPDELRDLARFEGLSSDEFQSALEFHRETNITFFHDFDVLGIDSERLRDDVKAAVNPLVGVLVSILVVVWLGWLVGGFLGRKLMQRVDRALHFIPIVKSVYPYSKQLVDFFFAEREIEFETVCAIPYPSPGIWSISFVTSSALKTLRRETGHNLVSCFVPSSPMPMTGYTVFIEASKLVPLQLTVDEALRITMTGGVLIPPKERVGGEQEISVLLEEEVAKKQEAMGE